MRLLACVLSLLLATGCSRAVKVSKPNPVAIDGGTYDRTYRAAGKALRAMGFELDRQDYRFGEVTTQPQVAPTIFEPWHGDNTTLGQAGQSTLGYQRRIARVTLKPDAATARQVTRVDVEAVPFTGVEAAVRQIDTSLEGDGAPTTVAYGRYLLEVEVTIERQQRPTRRLTGSTAGRNIFGSLRSVPEEWQARGITAQYWLELGRDLELEQRVLQAILEKAGEAVGSRD